MFITNTIDRFAAAYIKTSINAKANTYGFSRNNFFEHSINKFFNFNNFKFNFLYFDRKTNNKYCFQIKLCKIHFLINIYKEKKEK